MHEASCLCPRPVPRRAAGVDERTALAGCLCPASVPDAARQRTRRVGAPHRAAARLQRPDRAQRHRRLQHQGPRCPHPRLARRPQPRPRLQRRCLRAAPGAAASQPARLRRGDEPLDAGPPCRRQLRGGADQRAGQRRDRAGDPGAAGHPLEAGQALDHQSRSGVCPKKSRRDRLIRLAARQPDWVLGFEDEVWWSRVSQPSAHAWTAEQPLRLAEQTVAKDDPDPKALAAYGLLVEGAGSAEPEVWLRFVAERPVSDATTAFLDWCAAGLAARGITALLLVWDNASWHLSKAVRSWLREHN